MLAQSSFRVAGFDIGACALPFLPARWHVFVRAMRSCAHVALAGDTTAMRLRVLPAFAGVTIACDGDQALQPRSGNQDQPHDVISWPSRKSMD